MDVLQKIITNGFVLIIPIILWNIIFIPYLPSYYAPTSFNSDIPLWIIVGENLFRIVLFGFPLFLHVNFKLSFANRGLVVYLFGVALYFLSWLAIILSPASMWSTSLLGFSASAYTPIIWIVGLSMMVNGYYFKLHYSKWHFLLPSLVLIVFHILHTVSVYNRSF